MKPPSDTPVGYPKGSPPILHTTATGPEPPNSPHHSSGTGPGNQAAKSDAQRVTKSVQRAPQVTQTLQNGCKMYHVYRICACFPCLFSAFVCGSGLGLSSAARLDIVGVATQQTHKSLGGPWPQRRAEARTALVDVSERILFCFSQAIG